MILPRIIPTLLFDSSGLIKGKNFKNHRYVGDPINAIYIFNEQEVDEIMLIDISPYAGKKGPSVDLVRRIAANCLVPFGIGGGVKTLEQARALLNAGAEKICVCTEAVKNPKLLEEIGSTFGAQSVVVSIDVKKNWLGKYVVMIENGAKAASVDLIPYLGSLNALPIGEVLIQSIDREGTRKGYDADLLALALKHSNRPIIASGGAGNHEHLKQAIQMGCSAAAAGSLFIFHGAREAVLINYPNAAELAAIQGQSRNTSHTAPA